MSSSKPEIPTPLPHSTHTPTRPITDAGQQGAIGSMPGNPFAINSLPVGIAKLCDPRRRSRGAAAFVASSATNRLARPSQPRPSLRRNRWILPVAVLGSAAANNTRRGYL